MTAGTLIEKSRTSLPFDIPTTEPNSNTTTLECLLFFPPLTKKEAVGGKAVNDKYGHLPPLGMAYLAAALLEKGFTVDVIEPLVLGLTEEDVLQRIARKRPRVVGLNALTPTFAKTVIMARTVRDHFPEMITIVGGTHPTLSYRGAVKGPAAGILDEHSWFDFACIGEGEITIVELMNFFKKYDYDREAILKNVHEADAIQGIVYREYGTEGRGIFTGERPFLDLDQLPLPARHLLPMERYLPFPVQYRRLPVVHMFVSRGCPWACTFCCTPYTWGRDVRFRSPEKVVEEMKRVMHDFGAKEISFWDDTFTANPKWLTQLCDLIVAEKLGIIWSCFGRVNDMTLPLAKKMKEGGCWEIFFGIESANQESLNVIKKGLSPAITRRAVKICQEAGIEIRGLFMLGLPKETPEKAEKTINFAIELDLDYAQFTMTTPHKGTDLYTAAKQYGMLFDEDSSRNTQNEAVFIPEGYRDAIQLNETVKRAYRRFYFRPQYWWKKIRTTRSLEDINRYYQGMKIALAMVNYKMENWKSDLSEDVQATLRSH